MARALSFARGTLNPHNFLYPTFYFYVLFAWVGVYLAWVWLSGRVASISALQQLYFTDPTGIYTAGRALGVAAGTATIAVLYRPCRAPDRSSHRDRRGNLPSRLASARPRLPLRQARCPGDARGRPRLPGDDACLALRARGGPATARHAPRRSGVRRRLLHALLLRLSGHPARARDRPGLARPRRGGLSSRQLVYGGAASLVIFLALSPFLARRAADGLARHHREPPDRHRPRRHVRRVCARRALSRDAVERSRWASRLRCSQASAWCGCWHRRPRAAVLLLAFPLPFLLFIANTAPASRYLNPVLPFLRYLRGLGAFEPDACTALAGDLLDRSWRSRRSRAHYASVDVRSLPAPGRHANAGRTLHRGQCAPGRDDPDAALLRRR